jgi:hypothetical protein
MDSQEEKTCTSLGDHINHMGRLTTEVQTLLAQIDARRRRERGKDGEGG